MSELPPIGYDDESVIPRQRLNGLLQQLEQELEKPTPVVQKILSYEQPLRKAAHEVSADLNQPIEQLIASCHQINQATTTETIQKTIRLTQSIRNLL